MTEYQIQADRELGVTPTDQKVVERAREPAGLLELPRSFEDLWLTPRLWSLGKGLFILAAFMSAGAIEPTILEAMLLGGSGLGLHRLLRERRPELVQAQLTDGDSAGRELALADLRDQVESDAAFTTDLKTAGLLGLPTVYFSLGSAITLGVLGSNSLGLSPVPWMAATLFASVPMVGHVVRGLKKWLNRRKKVRLLAELDREA